MRLNGWTWLVSGLIVTIMSGYVYLFIPKNGGPNTAMALFFFIGIVFLVIGITQIFFRRQDDKSVLDSIAKEPSEEKIVTMPAIENKQNKVDAAIEQMLQQKSQEIQPQAKPNMQGVETNNVHSTQHSNSFSQIYQYKGPAHIPSSGAHAQHPVSQHIQQQTLGNNQASTIHNMPHHAVEHQTVAHDVEHHPIQNTTEHSIKCVKCGNVNPGHSNYCHKCGNRLK
jgi:hypothetical protein